ncbi:hypothetical protein ACFYTQ_31670 [Nocardia sp. NPDC004068]|uniref:hypothetical protein n=1 Tax=Nocardia sp. NPDC004068 TaxID=3364303 RepID=UPI00368A014F
MAYLNVLTARFDGIEVEYKPSRFSEPLGENLPAVVYLNLEDRGRTSYLALTIEDARVLAERLPQILMVHDAAERLAAEMAVDPEDTDSAAVDEAGKAA